MHPALAAAAETIRSSTRAQVSTAVAERLKLAVHHVDASGDVAVLRHGAPDGWRWLDAEELEAVAERLRTA
jgi:hypothetical protein